MLDEEGKKTCEVIYEYAQDESKHESLAAFSECQAIVEWIRSHKGQLSASYFNMQIMQFSTYCFFRLK